LLRLIPTAETCIVPPARDPKKEYHKNYDWKLIEFARAIRYCLMSEKQLVEFGAHLNEFAHLLVKVDLKRRPGINLNGHCLIH